MIFKVDTTWWWTHKEPILPTAFWSDEHKCWCVELNTVEDLLALNDLCETDLERRKKIAGDACHAGVILLPREYWPSKDLPELEIYDNYRE